MKVRRTLVYEHVPKNILIIAVIMIYGLIITIGTDCFSESGNQRDVFLKAVM